MLRWVPLLCVGWVLLTPIRSNASELRLLPTSLSAPASTGFYARMDLRNPPAESPSIGFGWLALQLVPSLLFDASVALGQVSIIIGEGEGGFTLGGVIGAWAASAALSALLSTGWVYLIARLAGVQPPFLKMLGWSAAWRMAGALTSTLALFAFGHPEGIVIVSFVLGAIGGTMGEIAFGTQTDGPWTEMPFTPAVRPWEGSGPVNHTHAALQLPAVALRF